MTRPARTSRIRSTPITPRPASLADSRLEAAESRLEAAVSGESRDIARRRAVAGLVARLRAVRLHRGAAAFALALAAIASAPRPAHAEDGPRLRGDITVTADIVTLGNLLDGLLDNPGKPLFRSPDLGKAGVVPVAAVVAAIHAAGIERVDIGALTEVLVSRASHPVAADEMTAMISARLGETLGVAAADLQVTFTEAPPAMLHAAPEAVTPVSIVSLSVAPGGGRFEAVVALDKGEHGTERIRIGGTAVEVADVVLLNRPIAAGEAIADSDLRADRVPARGVRNPAPDIATLVGHVARRALPAGAQIAAADLTEPLMVKRGDTVLMVYRSAAITLTVSGRALANGALGASIPVVNLRSDRVIQSTVVSAGTVEVISARRVVADAGLR